MKARLIKYDSIIQLLLCTGKIKTLSNVEAYNFLLTFDSPNHYEGDSKWDYEGLTMEKYHGETIAYVNDDNILNVVNAKLFKNIFENKEANFVTVKEYANIHGKQPAIVRRFCQAGRIVGAIQKGKTWLIPENAPYPLDERIKNQEK